MPPYLLFSALIGAIYGTLFHLWRGTSIKDLPVYLLTGIVGFALGQALGDLIGLDILMIGAIHILEATITSFGSLFLIHWLKIK